MCDKPAFVDRNGKLKLVGHLRFDSDAARYLLLPRHGGIIICLLESGLGPLFFLGTMTEFDREAIGRIIERVAAREGLELVHWEKVGPRNNFVLRIYIDKPGGVSHGDCETVSNQVSTLLDVEDLILNRYVLEVSSPGIERGLYK